MCDLATPANTLGMGAVMPANEPLPTKKRKRKRMKTLSEFVKAKMKP